ncbi:MAG: amidohydrolase [Candidatus Marinimicrobia bacterium]|nr:amidohydrolase [Candidatus Neomarinimicrobiota bacterium]
MSKANKIIASFLLLKFLTFFGCSETVSADFIVKNGTIYTVNEDNPKASAVAVKEGKIIDVGFDTDMESHISRDTKILDLEGRTMVPGFIESHGHIMGLGSSKLKLDLNGVENYDEIVDMVSKAVGETEPGEWILGRGWHQSKWTPQPEIMVKGFQTHHKLSAVSPENPVYLTHASGHAGFANAKAMEIAGVLSGGDFNIDLGDEIFIERDDGEIIRDENGEPTGIFNEVAQRVISKHIPSEDDVYQDRSLELAMKECLINGVTSFQDAGSGRASIDTYRRFLDSGKMKIRLYVMLSSRDPELLYEWYERGPEIGLGNNFLTIRAIKLNADGALGSRGAWLLSEYNDRPGHFGMATQSMDYVYEVTQKGFLTGFQVNTHAIGDRANREVLDQYEKVFNEYPATIIDHRFRIEHAQHIDPDDIPRFKKLGVIASVQGIHMSSDRPWAIDRLGEKRIQEGAYVWKSLLKSGAVVINGTDAPVEPVSPIASFYASVSRKTLKGEPVGGYEAWEKMTRGEALKSYTLAAAYGAFEENIKGSIEAGKLADFTVLSRDIMTVPENQILGTKILYTIVNGEIAYQAKP